MRPADEYGASGGMARDRPARPHLSGRLDVITAKEIDDCNGSCAANQPDGPAMNS